MAAWTPEFTYQGEFSVEAWVGSESAGVDQTFFSTRGLCPGSCIDYSFDIKLEDDAFFGYGIRIDVGNGSFWLVTETIPFAWETGRYYHVVAVVSYTGATVFVDGAAIGTLPYSGRPFLFGPNRIPQIGVSNATGGVEWFDGLIDEVAVYRYALTAAQVAAHYAAGVGPRP